MEGERKRHRRHRGALIPIILVIIGVAVLLEQNGIITRHVLSQLWPLLLIFIGVWLLLAKYHRDSG